MKHCGTVAVALADCGKLRMHQLKMSNTISMWPPGTNHKWACMAIDFAQAWTELILYFLLGDYLVPSLPLYGYHCIQPFFILFLVILKKNSLFPFKFTEAYV